MALAARTPWRLIVKVTIGGIFIYAGAIKVMDPIGFARDVDNYHMLPWAVSVRLAFYLPWLEALCGVAVLCGLFYRGGLLVLSALVFIFIGATIAAKARGLDITCGCFGHASRNWSFSTHLAVDLVLLAAVVFLWLSERSRLRANSASGALALQQSLRAHQKKL